MRILADTDLCVASGQCALLAPAVFDQREDDAIVVVREPQPPADQEGVARHAVAVCPSGALRLVD